VVCVVVYTAAMMLRSAHRERQRPGLLAPEPSPEAAAD
jgi:hypothetical protein